jgi:hypothetical protein
VKVEITPEIAQDQATRDQVILDLVLTMEMPVQMAETLETMDIPTFNHRSIQ